jgi:hypothetical protein
MSCFGHWSSIPQAYCPLLQPDSHTRLVFRRAWLFDVILVDFLLFSLCICLISSGCLPRAHCHVQALEECRGHAQEEGRERGQAQGFGSAWCSHTHCRIHTSIVYLSLNVHHSLRRTEYQVHQQGYGQVSIPCSSSVTRLSIVLSRIEAHSLTRRPKQCRTQVPRRTHYCSL